MSKYLATLRIPLLTLAVTVLGVVLATWWFDNNRWFLLLAVVPFSIGISLGRIADKRLLPKSPVAALYALEGWVIAPVTLAVVAAAFVVIATVILTVPDSASTVTKQTIGALSTGITTFLTTGFIVWTGDSDKSPIAEHVRDVFQRHYLRGEGGKPAPPDVHFFAAGSVGELLVQSGAGPGVDGWGWPDRLERARGIAEELRSGASDRKPPGV